MYYKMYKFVPYNEVMKYMPLIIANKVSEVARSKGQFLDQYKKYGTNLPEHWLVKREGFIKRHLAQYKINPTLRRQLALMAWAYKI
jgi:hypothetical protein